MFISRKVALACVLLGGSSQAFAEPVTVKEGDTLSGLARRYLGDADLWPDICKQNIGVLRNNCNLLIVGTTLTISGSTEVLTPTTDKGAAPVTDEAKPLLRAVDQIDEQGNLLKSSDDLTESSAWSAANGLTVLPHATGGFELTSDGTKDPLLQQRIEVKPTGHTYRFTIEAKAGNSAGATSAVLVYGYASNGSDVVQDTIIARALQPLSDEFIAFDIEVEIKGEIPPNSTLIYRLDPGDGNPDGTNTPPQGYSIIVRNPTVVQLD